MKASDYDDWTRRAFLYSEAALTQELAFTPSGGGERAAGSSTAAITEELVRSSFVKGLVHTKPEEAHRIRTEFNAKAGTTCWHDANHVLRGSGRTLQHDIAVVAGKDRAGANDAGMCVEVKWLKEQKTEALARDIWKVLFARGESAPAGATRVYLLVGGERKAFTSTMKSLRKTGVDLRWSNAGAGTSGPARRLLSVDEFFATKTGYKAFGSLHLWTDPKTKVVHHREPQDCLSRVYISRRAHWQRTVLGTSLRLVLWEIVNHGAANEPGI